MSYFDAGQLVTWLGLGVRELQPQADRERAVAGLWSVLSLVVDALGLDGAEPLAPALKRAAERRKRWAAGKVEAGQAATFTARRCGAVPGLEPMMELTAGRDDAGARAFAASLKPGDVVRVMLAPARPVASASHAHEGPCPLGDACPDARRYGAIHPPPAAEQPPPTEPAPVAEPWTAPCECMYGGECTHDAPPASSSRRVGVP
jgi:hypothetical protein